MKTFASNLAFPEAPVLLPDGGLLCVQMSPETGCITQISADGTTMREVAKTGRPNGLARDRNGTIWVAESTRRAVMKVTPGGEVTEFAHGSAGKRFRFLNDIAIAPNGDLYVTDSGIVFGDVVVDGVLHPQWRDLAYDGSVFRVSPISGEVELVDEGMLFTNGIAFGPDSALYVNETFTGNIYRYDYRDGRVTGRRELFGNVIEKFEREALKGPDGMKFAADGCLYVAVFGQGDVTVLDPKGRVLRRLGVDGMHPTNLAFGPPGSGLAYVTVVDTASIQVLDVGVDGLALHG